MKDTVEIVRRLREKYLTWFTKIKKEKRYNRFRGRENEAMLKGNVNG